MCERLRAWAARRPRQPEVSQGRLKRDQLIFTWPSCSLSKKRQKERVGEKIKHLRKSLILPTLRVLSCPLGFRKRFYRFHSYYKQEAWVVGHETALKEACDQLWSEDATGLAGSSTEHSGVTGRKTTVAKAPGGRCAWKVQVTPSVFAVGLGGRGSMHVR